MAMLLNIIWILLSFTIIPIQAQFFFDNLFQGQQQQQPQNAGSDSSWYRQRYADAHCDKYLCPHTLSCVAFPHHCPCAFEAVEDKVEFGEGSMACASKGGFKSGETARKIELARKGLL